MFFMLLIFMFVDGYSGLVLLRAHSTLHSVQHVISNGTEASETQSFFLVVNSLLPFQSGFLPFRVPTFDGSLS